MARRQTSLGCKPFATVPSLDQASGAFAWSLIHFSPARLLILAMTLRTLARGEAMDGLIANVYPSPLRNRR